MSNRSRKAPFPWFGGKSTVADYIWRRLGSPKQYIEPFCGSAAILLASPRPASLEVIGDANCYVANFWRALKFGPDDVTRWQDYPVSHIDLAARHRWLTEPARVAALREKLANPEWPGDPQIAGWWLWGQCCWIGSGWCDPNRSNTAKWDQIPHGDGSKKETQARSLGKIPHSGDAGRGVQATTLGQIPHSGSAGMGVQATTLGQIPHSGSAGMGVQDSAASWLRALADRLARVRVIHGDWSRCLNHHYGSGNTAVFLDPPYLAFERLYSDTGAPVAEAVAAWAREHAHLRIALCGHFGDYEMPGWDVYRWSRGRSTYGGHKTTDAEAIWFSPGCVPEVTVQAALFGADAP